MRVSVVATGMDAAVVVQPETIGRFQTARPALQPATAAPAPAQAARTAQTSAATSSRYARSAEPAAKATPDLEAQTDATVWPELARAPETVRAEAPSEARTPEPRVAASEAPPVIRIIDPSVEDDSADAYGGSRGGYDARRAGPAPLNNEPRQKGGWLSLFGGGRPRYDAPAAQPAYAPAPTPAPREPVQQQPRAAAAPVPQARTTQSAQLAEEPRGDEGEDLNIPSFLRRLAN
jgi:cell division protein FtsZ